MDVIEIEVINWEKYNPRTDRKKSSWFRLENGIAAEPKFYGLSASQKFVAICLFAEASKKCGASATINVSWLADQLKIKVSEIHKTIEHLISVGVAKVLSGAIPVSSGCPTNERTNERNVRMSDSSDAFKSFYSKYPRKEKKSEAKKRFDGLIKAGTDAEEINKALSRYLAHLTKNKTDKKYYKLPTTFLGEVDDWLEDDAGETKLAAVSGQGNYNENAKELWQWLSNGAPLGPETDHLARLANMIGFEQLQKMHRDDFRPGGQVPALLQQAEKAAS